MSQPKPTSSPPLSNQLRTQVCLTYLFMQSGHTIGKFDELISTTENRSGLVKKWLKNQNSMSREKLKSIVEKDPEKFKLALELFDFPLFTLLDDGELKKLDISNLLKGWYTGNWDNESNWIFPTNQFLNFGAPQYQGKSPIKGMWGTYALQKRGDIYAFTALAAILKMTEIEYPMTNISYLPKISRPLQAMFSLLPAIAKHPLFGPHIQLLMDCVKEIELRNVGPIGYPYYYVNLEQIKREIAAVAVQSQSPSKIQSNLLGV